MSWNFMKGMLAGAALMFMVGAGWSSKTAMVGDYIVGQSGTLAAADTLKVRAPHAKYEVNRFVTTGDSSRSVTFIDYAISQDCSVHVYSRGCPGGYMEFNNDASVTLTGSLSGYSRGIDSVHVWNTSASAATYTFWLRS